ncbi:MAG: leucine-rich repeat domain-containing protein [Clostridia bacterium]|nr:leucine-rich repeat domain-containing protein [Clostridia bacterium]
MSKDKKEDLIIDAVSGIDEDIVDKNLKKRFELWCKKGAKRLSMLKIAAIAACVALLASFIVVILPLIPTGQIPVYQGMTVSNEAPPPAAETASNRPFTSNRTLSLLGKHSGKEEQKTRRPVVDIVKDSLTVDAESEYLYYAKPGEDIYITVHINNPGEFEILSFTLNGVKYSTYMFEEGSDLENLVLKVNVGDAEGVVEYTIDAIKYVDGTKIKDVLMEGDKTVSVAITPDAPTSEITDVNIGISDISFNTYLNDEKNLVNTSGEDYFAVICNNDTIVEKKIISSKDKTPISFTGLDPDTTYRYAIIGVYDAIDGEGKCIHVIHEEEFTTQALVSIGDSYLDGADVCFDITWHEGYTGNKTLDALALYDGENKLFDLDVTSDRIADLPFDKEFTLVAIYTYNGTQYETYKTIYSPKTSEGLEMSYGVVVGVGSCSDTVLYINAPIAESAFKDNTHIKEVYLGSGVETVGNNAFGSCSELTTVGISDGVKRIEGNAFHECNSLKAVRIGDVGSWCEIEFENTTSNPLYYAKNLYLNGELVADLVIPEGITSINRYAFNNCTSIETVTIPDSFNRDNWEVFIGCENLDVSNFVPDDMLAHINNDDLIVYTNSDDIDCSITYTNEGTSFNASASEDAFPWIRLVSKEKVDLKNGIYMKIRIDEFDPANEPIFSFMLSDQRYVEFGMPEYDDNVIYNITRLSGSDGCWTDWNNTSLPTIIEQAGNGADGKLYLTVKLFWDEVNSTFVYSINDSVYYPRSVPQQIISIMNGRWGNNNSEVYFSIFLTDDSGKVGSVGCTVLEYGTSAEDATVPSGN